MRAIRVHQPGPPAVLQLDEIPVPKPGADEVLIEIRAVAVNPVDAYIRSGTYAKARPQYPYIPGNDAAGVIRALGAGARGFTVGDRVYLTGSGHHYGAYAEMIACPTSRVAHMPANVTFAQGATLSTAYATAQRALYQKLRIARGETLLVHGASGGVGVAAVQMAVASGVNVIGTAGSERGLRLVLDQGARWAVDHTRVPTYLDEIMTLTDGQGVDAVLENLSNVNLDRDLDVVKKFGRVVIIGSRGRVEINPRTIMEKDISVLGTVLPNSTSQELAEIHAALRVGLENGSLRPVIGRELPLKDAALAHELVFERAYGKIILVP